MKCEPAMTMREILAGMPGARRALFAKYHLGGCQSCAFSMEETLVELCEREGIEVEEMVEYLGESDRYDQGMLVSAVEVARVLAGGGVVLDMRTREEFESVPLVGARFLTQEVQQELFAEKSHEPVYLVDHLGKNVLDLVSWFRGHGVENAFGVRGGIDAWSCEVDVKIPRYRIEVDG